jgi:hypothetical protein
VGRMSEPEVEVGAPTVCDKNALNRPNSCFLATPVAAVVPSHPALPTCIFPGSERNADSAHATVKDERGEEERAKQDETWVRPRSLW